MGKIKLEVGMQAKCAIFGDCIISEIRIDSHFPIVIKQSDGNTQSFTSDGRILYNCNPSLKLLNIPFTEGLEVECDIYGSGVVYAINPDTDTALRVLVQFADGHFIHYTIDGRIDLKANQTLFPKYEI